MAAHVSAAAKKGTSAVVRPFSDLWSIHYPTKNSLSEWAPGSGEVVLVGCRRQCMLQMWRAWTL